MTRGRSSTTYKGGLLTIGALAAATGIPVETIRTWERRYGFPRAERKPSGHRLYPLDTVLRLRRISAALARGHRAAEVVTASDAALDALLALPEQPESLPAVVGAVVAPQDDAEWIAAVRTFDVHRLRAACAAEWARLGPLDFLERRVAPFLVATGAAWAAGTLDVRHEHFASTVIGDFLRAVRHPLEERATGPVVGLATLPGELHGLGLEMAAVVLARAGWRPLLLGVDTPVNQIASLARETRLAAVAVSCVCSPSKRAGYSSALKELRRALPKRVPLLVGGSAAPELAAQGVYVMRDLLSLDGWIRRGARSADVVE
ncbi:MAG TPA: MerR family transcriptional regulator [Gemmatimonadaceae bacterium]|nr:MerR family transcriptional regulator [Gemmatimonadaceae bacterium]